MSNRFTQKNIFAFLTESGADADVASYISNLVVASVRASTGTDIKDQRTNHDFSEYDAILENGNDSLEVQYVKHRLGPNFFDHKVTVTNGDYSYGTSSFVHTPYSPQSVEAVESVVEESQQEATYTGPVTEVVETPVAISEPEVVVDAPTIEAVENEQVVQEVDVAQEAPVVEVEQEVQETPVVEVSTETPAESEEVEQKKPKKKTSKKQ